MCKYAFFFLFVGQAFGTSTIFAQEGMALELPGMPLEISQVMSQQQSAWNQGDLQGFMQGYWKSDSLIFVGSTGVTTGHQSTLERYMRSYPDRETMGELNFANQTWIPLSSSSGWLLGSWALTREGGEEVSGMYTLLWRRLEGRWCIVADHSS